MILTITFIMAALNFTGGVLNAKKKRICFLFWGVTNIFWIVRNIIIGEYAQALMFASGLCVTVYGFIKWSRAKENNRNKESFHVRNDQEEVVWIYYNPDSDAGGQYVENIFRYDLILDAKRKTQNTDDFFDYIHSECKQYLIDIGTEYFDDYDTDKPYGKSTFSRSDRKAMNKLVNLAKKSEGETK